MSVLSSLEMSMMSSHKPAAEHVAVSMPMVLVMNVLPGVLDGAGDSAVTRTCLLQAVEQSLTSQLGGKAQAQDFGHLKIQLQCFVDENTSADNSENLRTAARDNMGLLVAALRDPQLLCDTSLVVLCLTVRP